MIVKIVTLFLVVIAVLGMFGRLRLPKIGQLKQKRVPTKCPACGRPRIGNSNAPCDRSDCPFGKDT